MRWLPSTTNRGDHDGSCGHDEAFVRTDQRRRDHGFGELLADDFVEHEETPGLEPTKDGAKQFFHMYRAAFPDLRMEAQDILASGDKVVARVRATGTHQGEFLGIPASGKRVDVQLIDIIRFGDDGLAREHWGVFDALAMLQQLGAIPEAPHA